MNSPSGVEITRLDELLFFELAYITEKTHIPIARKIMRKSNIFRFNLYFLFCIIFYRFFRIYEHIQNCKEKNYIFGRSTTKSIVEKFDIDLLAELPIREEIAINVDRGNVEAVELPEMDAVANKIIAELN